MSADWSRLTSYLRGRPDRVKLSWQELDDLVGGIPASALNHPAWWGGDRPHKRAWQRAGFELVERRPGVSVVFQRTTPNAPEAAVETLRVSNAVAGPDVSAVSDVLLIGCGSTKADRPTAARDLYTSPTFRKARTYAEQSGKRWFILSAEHGLVAPEEWLAPYDRYLPDTPPAFRRAWGEWVAARLELLLGTLRDTICEVHAGREYLAAAAPALKARGARIVLPLEGLRQGERLAWYDKRLGGVKPPAVAEGQTPDRGISEEDPAKWAEILSDAPRAVPPPTLEAAKAELQRPGLYSWWVDAEGASDLSRGLGQPVGPGLIYAGQAGATRWPSGRASANTLWLRLVGMHLGKKARFSTFRKTLGSILRAERGWAEIDEVQLTAWMHDHLRVIAVPHPDGTASVTWRSGCCKSWTRRSTCEGWPPLHFGRRCGSYGAPSAAKGMCDVMPARAMTTDGSISNVNRPIDELVSFDPVRNTVPGLENYQWVRRLREPSYATARRSRR